MHDKIEKDVWWTIILGFIGIAFILKPSELIFHSGALLGIAAGVFSAFSLVSIRILNQKQASLSRTLLYYFIVATIITFPLAIATWKSPTLLDCLCLIIIGASTIIGQILLTIAYRHGTASFLSPLSYSIVIFILLISWIIFKQKPETLSFIGTALIVFGGTFSFVLRKRPKTFLKLFEHPNFYKRSRWGRKKKKPPE
jgi:drug/metabolite transporter (DMT)-like permease